jgi:hypothetical protein
VVPYNIKPRLEPDLRSKRSKWLLPAGSAVTVLRADLGWAEIEGEAETGWVTYTELRGGY